MHLHPAFEQRDTDNLKEFIHSNPFATLVCNTSNGIEADHIPFTLARVNQQDVLQAHIAKANCLWKTADEKSSVLVIFKGPDCYVSPNYYPSKKVHGKAVPTWNYVAVHVKGVISFIHDEQWILQMMDQLTNQQETSQAKPWATSDAPSDYIKKLSLAVVGIEIPITEITGQWKLSQNQPESNQAGVMSGLAQETNAQSRAIANLMKRKSDPK